MTRERHIIIVMKVGKVSREVATRVVDRVLEEIEMEQEEEPQAVDFPTSRPDVDRLAPPVGQQSSIVPVREVKVEPIRPPEPVSNTRYWAEVDLNAFLEANVPTHIQVVPDGMEKALTLVRDLTPMVGLGMVKVSFAQRDAARPAESQRNTNGLPPERMAIDTVISETFSVYDEQPPIEAKMNKIRDAARLAFRPRPERIISHTQIRGPLVADQRVPHEDV